jgi:protein disulfide-isomerase A1
LKHNQNLVIAEMDATENDSPGVDIRGFPTIILFPAAGKPHSTYEGPREIHDFVTFLQSNAHFPVDYPPIHHQ